MKLLNATQFKSSTYNLVTGVPALNAALAGEAIDFGLAGYANNDGMNFALVVFGFASAGATVTLKLGWRSGASFLGSVVEYTTTAAAGSGWFSFSVPQFVTNKNASVIFDFVILSSNGADTSKTVYAYLYDVDPLDTAGRVDVGTVVGATPIAKTDIISGDGSAIITRNGRVIGSGGSDRRL